MLLSVAVSRLPPSQAPCADVLGALRCAGVLTVEALICAPLGLLATRCGINEALIEQLALDLSCVLVMAPRSACEVQAEHPEQNVLLSCGIDALDALLGGGVLSGEVCALIGPTRSAKTQLCLGMAAETLARTDAAVLYVSACHCFDKQRVHALMRRRLGCAADFMAPLSPDDDCSLRMARQLRVCIAETLPKLCQVLEQLLVGYPAAQADWFCRLRLLVVDPVFGAILAEATCTPSSTAAAQLARLQRLLREIASRLRLAVLVTSACAQHASPHTANTELPSVLALKPVAAHVWQHVAHVRVLMQSCDRLASDPSVSAEPVTHTATLVKSYHCARRLRVGTSASFRVCSEGLISQ